MNGPRELMSHIVDFVHGKKDFPQKQDYDTSDETVKMLFETADNYEGFHEKVASSDFAKRVIAAMADTMKVESLSALRYAHHNLLKISDSNDNFVVMAEDLDSGIEDLSEVEHRYEALSGLSKYSELNPDVDLDDVNELILAGDEASIRNASAAIRMVYSANAPSENIRVAYTNIATQPGEPHMLCPKATKQIGYAVPMEVSKCRDYCIDSRKTKDGHISCTYQDWLKVAADNQESALARLENSKVHENEEKTLNEIHRGPDPAEEEMPLDQQREDSDLWKDQNKKYDREELTEMSIEEALDDRGLNTKQSSSENDETKKRSVTASTNNNIKLGGKMKKSFNLKNHLSESIKGEHISERLEEFRNYFSKSHGYEAAREMNLNSDNSKYEDPNTSMEELVGEKHTGNPEATMEEQMEAKRNNDEARGMTQQEDSLDSRRNNDGMDVFMKTLNESLDAKRHN
jgi:hypothetical protein